MSAIRFCFWYARRDLFAPSARPVTRVACRSIALVVALAVMTFGLVLGSQRLLRDRLRREPLAQSLFVGESSLGERIPTRKTVAALDAELDRRVGAGKASTRPFREVSYGFADADPAKQPILLYGGSVKADDAIVDRLFPPVSRRFDVRGRGLLISRELLRRLHYQPESADPVAPPPRLRLFLGSQSEGQEVPVLAITEVRLPLGLTFLVVEEEQARLWDALAEEESTVVRTGPLPPGWPSGNALPEGLRRRIRDLALNLPTMEDTVDGKGRCWQFVKRREIDENARARLELEAADGPGGPGPVRALPEIAYSKAKWLEKLTAVAEAVRRTSLPPPTEGFLDLTLVRGVRPRLPALTPYIEVTVRDLDDLEAAGAACRAVGYPADDTAIRQIREIARNGAAALQVSILLLAAVGLNVFANLVALERLRAALKLPEIGMMKAMGIPAGRLLGICRASAWMFWVRGASLGVAAGLALSYAVAWFHFVDRDRPEELALAVVVHPALWVPAVALAATMASVQWGTRAARRSSPMATLRIG